MTSALQMAQHQAAGGGQTEGDTQPGSDIAPKKKPAYSQQQQARCPYEALKAKQQQQQQPQM